MPHAGVLGLLHNAHHEVQLKVHPSNSHLRHLSLSYPQLSPDHMSSVMSCQVDPNLTAVHSRATVLLSHTQTHGDGSEKYAHAPVDEHVCCKPGHHVELTDGLLNLQGVGILSAAIVSLVTLSCFHHSIVTYGEAPLAPP